MNKIIEKLIPLANAHRDHDQYSRGIYWNGQDGPGLRGCAIGCTIRDAVGLGLLAGGTSSSDHKALAEATGLEQEIWALADTFFERIPRESAPSWPPVFLLAAAACADGAKATRLLVARYVDVVAEATAGTEFFTAATSLAALWLDLAVNPQGDHDERILAADTVERMLSRCEVGFATTMHEQLCALLAQFRTCAEAKLVNPYFAAICAIRAKAGGLFKPDSSSAWAWCADELCKALQES